MTIREIEALVAKKVMGIELLEGELVWKPNSIYSFPLPAYASTWAGMGLVVEEMINRCFWPTMEYVLGEWGVNFIDASGERDDKYWGYSKSAPLAVSLAALRAVGVEIRDEEIPKLKPSKKCETNLKLA